MNYLFVVFTALFAANLSFGQVNNPVVQKKTNTDVHIESVETGKDGKYTEIIFSYINTGEEGHYMWVSAPGHEDAFYIQAGGKKYRLIDVEGIGSKEGETFAEPFQGLLFVARFEKIPDDLAEFDLIEGKTGNWNFYGVQLTK